MGNGNWEKAVRIEKLKNTPVIILEENTYKGKYEITGSIAQNKKSITKYLSTLVTKNFYNKDISGPIKISGHGIDEITQFGMKNPLYMKLIVHIPEFIEKSVFIESQPPKKKKYHFSKYHQLVIGAKIEGKDLIIRSVLGEENGNWYYSFFVTEKNIGELLEELRSPNAVPQGTTPYTIQDKPLRELLQENFSHC